MSDSLDPAAADLTTPSVDGMEESLTIMIEAPVQPRLIVREDTSGSTGVLASDEAAALKGLTEDVRNQDDLERDITNQANLAMIEEADERDQKRIQKTIASVVKLESQEAARVERLSKLANSPLMRQRCVEELAQIREEIAGLKKDVEDIQKRIDERHLISSIEEDADTSTNRRMPNESQREFLIRTGKITPFSRISDRGPSEGPTTELKEILLDAEEAAIVDSGDGGSKEDSAEPRSHQNLRAPGFAASTITTDENVESEFSLRPRKKRKLENAATSARTKARRLSSDEDSAAAFAPSDSEQEDDVFDEEDEDDALMTSRTTKKRTARRAPSEEKVDLTGIDDGNEDVYQARLEQWVSSRSAARKRKIEEGQMDNCDDSTGEEEWYKPCPDAPDHILSGDLKLPGDIYPALFDYQKTGVQWLGELFHQQVGGIIGDEMGLGKTIQIISFLAGLHYSQKLTKPIIVVAPATVLRQWVNEFHRWWPPLRVSILHSSGSGMMNVGSEGRQDDAEDMYGIEGRRTTQSHKAAKRIVKKVVEHGHVLVTTYAGLQTYADVLIPVEWDYAVLDEGHKIRNPNTAITIHCKELRTPNRVILSGTPMQNNIVELWSLFDFITPMRLGTLVDFRQQFEVPIKIGGYANATNLQVLTATKCAETLKAAISPYLLQRLKVDVASDLPKKSEQVLFCKLTKPQRDAYERFLNSEEMDSIMKRTRQSLYGIDILRKICNHPDLTDPQLRRKPGYKWGSANKSGKMQVVKALLEMWKGFGHKTLLFSQGVQMLNIIEDFVKSLGGFNYLRMDGSTNIKDRQVLVDRFNNEPDLHVFLLTTKVGGLGVNLTGANRVIIFDPDWNPSTDVQARERAWRLGQKKEVTIYRLMTAGTIEEKIYHRQIFKQFLTHKILKDPKQRATFQMKDLYDLFTLGSADDGGKTETGQMFGDAEVNFNQPSSVNPPAPSTPEAAPVDQGDVATQVRSLIGVAGLETFKESEASLPTKSSSPSSTPADESRLMSSIFARSGVHSALEHDQIINGKKKITADAGMLEREAKRVAAAAAAELRKAGEAARNVIPGTVTWTGEFGEAGRPVNMRRGGAAGRGGRGLGPGSSSSILLSNRQNALHPPSSTSSSRSNTSLSATGGASRPSAAGGRDFMRLIRDFMRAHGGSVPSQALVNHFSRMCTTARKSAEFKHMLGEIAVLEQPPRGASARMRGKWVLKEEFR